MFLLRKLLRFLKQQSNTKKNRMHIYNAYNLVPTRLLKWEDPSNNNRKDLIVCITGNPGIPDFYTEFALQLHNELKMPVCVIGQAGHDDIAETESYKKQEHLFNLQGQVKHKLDFIKSLDNNCKLHLIGHSIGAWLIVELLLQEPDLIRRISTVNLLFPTVQRMAESKSGIFLNHFIRRFHTLCMFFFMLVYVIPESIRLLLVNLYLKCNSLPNNYAPRILKLLNPKVGEKIMYLAYDEMDNVTDLNMAGFQQIKHLTNVIYSTRDGWAPLSYMEDIKQFEPTIEMKKVDFEHAFVMKSSEDVAALVVDFIKNRI